MQHLPDADEYKQGPAAEFARLSPDIRYDNSSLTKIVSIMHIILLEAVRHACNRLDISRLTMG